MKSNKYHTQACSCETLRRHQQRGGQGFHEMSRELSFSLNTTKITQHTEKDPTKKV
jgi:hypothetical protein